LLKRTLTLILMFTLALSCAVLSAPDDLIGFWEFTPERLSGAGFVAQKGLTGTLNGLAQFVDGPYGKSLYFNGVDNRIQYYTGAPSGITLPTRELTIETWVKIEAYDSWKGIISYAQDNNDYERGFFLGVVNGKFTAFVVTARDGSNPRMDVISCDTDFDFSKWYHLTFTYDGARMKLYVDGLLVKESSQAFGDIIYPEKGTLVIGAFIDDNEQEHIKGAIREVRLYSRALSESEIMASVPGKSTSLPLAASAIEGSMQVLILLNDKTTLEGILQQVDGTELVLKGADGKTTRVDFSKVLAILPLGQ
jgi:hypothetical protein